MPVKPAGGPEFRVKLFHQLEFGDGKFWELDLDWFDLFGYS